MALTEIEFYQYFLNADNDLYNQRKILEKRLKANIYDFGTYDLLRDVNARIEEHKKIYSDLKGFFEINRNMLNKLKLTDF